MSSPSLVAGLAAAAALFGVLARPAAASPAAGDDEEISNVWWILGAAGVGTAVALETTTYHEHRHDDVGKCNTVACVATWWPAGSLVAPTSSAFLFVWGWRVGDREGRAARLAGTAGDHT